MRTELDDVTTVLRVMTAVRGLTELEVAALLRAVEMLLEQDATIAALLAVPDDIEAALPEAERPDIEGRIKVVTLDGLRARMAAVVEGE
jgi:hypothetical protein